MYLQQSALYFRNKDLFEHFIKSDFEIFMESMFMETVWKTTEFSNSLKINPQQLGSASNYIYNQAIHDLLNQVFFRSNFITIINDTSKHFRPPALTRFKLQLQIQNIKAVLIQAKYNGQSLFQIPFISLSHIRIHLAALHFLLETSLSIALWL